MCVGCGRVIWILGLGVGHVMRFVSGEGAVGAGRMDGGSEGNGSIGLVMGNCNCIDNVVVGEGDGVSARCGGGPTASGGRLGLEGMVCGGWLEGRDGREMMVEVGSSEGEVGSMDGHLAKMERAMIGGPAYLMWWTRTCTMFEEKWECSFDASVT
jgi:hypothetical protein